MKEKAIATGVLILLLILGVGASQAQGPEPPEAASLQAPLGTTASAPPALRRPPSMSRDAAEGLSTSFTYQGQLKRRGEVISAVCSMAFRLYDAAEGGVSVGSPLTPTVPVSNSLFTVQLDFGASAFTGDARWLGVRVMCPGDVEYADLGRQPLTAAPYALYALGAPWSGLRGIPPGFADGVDDVTAVVSGTNIFAGDGLTLAASGNAVTMSVYFAGSGGDYGTAVSAARSDHAHDERYYAQTELQTGGSASVHWDNLTNLPPGLADGDDDALADLVCADEQVAKWNDTASEWVCGDDEVSTGGADWSLTGNAGTDPSANFLGTTDAVSLTLAVNGMPALRLSPVITSPNVIGGYGGNGVGPGVAGASIGGGGMGSAVNGVYGDYGAVGGGIGNAAYGELSTVAGGEHNAAGYGAAVGGGDYNHAQGDYSVIAGGDASYAAGSHTFIGSGLLNYAGGPMSVIAGGESISVTGYAATVAGGAHITVTGNYAAVGGGWHNVAGGSESVIGGGWGNRASGSSSTVGGGWDNTAANWHATVGGGLANSATGDKAAIGGGHDNTASGFLATVGGGYNNVASGDDSTIGGGWSNLASGWRATVGGGQGNIAIGVQASIGGGEGNVVTATHGTIAGGYNITVTGDYASVGGGAFNTASGVYAAVGGGASNAASEWGAAVGGGYGNIASGWDATVGGGDFNTASAYAATVGGGFDCTADHTAATVGGGFGNAASGIAATIGGGESHLVDGTYSTIAGGYNITVTGSYAAVGGGYNNTTSDWAATVGGGYNNTASGEWTTIGGGYNNTASGDRATVGGGHDNTASGIYYATVGGGWFNNASGGYATVCGGGENTASGWSATVPGGAYNVAEGDHSFAAGRRARALHQGTFVWADSTDADFDSTGNNQFRVRANGGARMYTGANSSYFESTGGNHANSTLVLYNIGGGSAAYMVGNTGSPLAEFDQAGLGAVLDLQNSGDVDGNSGGNFITGYSRDDSFDLQFRITTSGQGRSDVGWTTPAEDFAEMLPAVAGLEPGDVLAIGPDGTLVRSTSPYQTSVAGVYSTQPGFIGGHPVEGPVAGTIPLAVVGIVPVKVTAENGAILPGDLLVASSTPGHAMKAGPNPPQGTVIGKALESLDVSQGTDVIKMLATLQ